MLFAGYNVGPHYTMIRDIGLCVMERFKKVLWLSGQSVKHEIYVVPSESEKLNSRILYINSIKL